MEFGNTMTDDKTAITISRELQVCMQKGPLYDSCRAVVALLTEIRDENRQNVASLQAQMHIMQERLARMDTKPVSGYINYTEMGWRSDITQTEEADISGSESVHRECLQEHLNDLVETFDLQKTVLVDKLIEESCLTENEASQIRQHTDIKDQTRNLVVTIGKRSKQKFERFLNSMENEHPELCDVLRKRYKSKLEEGKRPSKCLICVIKQDVNIRHVVDKLVSSRVVDLEFLDFFCKNASTSLSQQSNLWDLVFANVDKSQNRKDKIKHLTEALYDKYEHISAKLGLWHHPRLICSCKSPKMVWSPRPNFADSFSSLTSEISSTSDVDDRRQCFKGISTNAEPNYDSLTSIDDKYSNIPYTVHFPEVQCHEVSSTQNDDELVVSSGDFDDESHPEYNRQDSQLFNITVISTEYDLPGESILEPSTMEQADEATTSNKLTIESRNASFNRSLSEDPRVDSGKRKNKRRQPSSAWVARHRRTKSEEAPLVHLLVTEPSVKYDSQEEMKRCNSIQDILERNRWERSGPNANESHEQTLEVFLQQSTTH